NDFHSTVRVPVVFGQSYKIRVGGWGPNDRGTGELLVECQSDCDTVLNLRAATPVNPLGYNAGDDVTVVLEMSEPCAPVAGFQAFIAFDEAELTFVSGSYTAAPFGQPIIDPIAAVGGTIDLRSTWPRASTRRSARRRPTPARSSPSCTSRRRPTSACRRAWRSATTCRRRGSRTRTVSTCSP
ncbi:MAG: hypothetical protein ACYTJ0_19450, partial [Planctomycetota bacterium]